MEMSHLLAHLGAPGPRPKAFTDATVRGLHPLHSLLPSTVALGKGPLHMLEHVS